MALGMQDIETGPEAPVQRLSQTSTVEGPEPTSPQLAVAIALLEANDFSWLHHTPELEAYFDASSAPQRVRRFYLLGIFCIAVYNAFLIGDFVLFPHHFLHFVIVRLGCVTPPTLLAIYLLRRGLPKKLREGLVVVICGLFAISLLYLYFGISPVVSSYAVADLSILVMFANVGIRCRLPYAFFSGAMCLVFGAIYLLLDPTFQRPEKVESLMILMSAVVLSVIANYTIERGERLNFLRRVQAEVNYGVLTNANDELQILARQDRMTGLANRGYFDESYHRIWSECIAQTSSLSVIMIDIDNFKALNDSYGHLYGDAVLQRVAMLLKQALRREGDFLARYGGEEFVVVLPDTAAAAGLRVAERIRLLVEVAGSPAVSRVMTHEDGWGTVSCGLATTAPRAGMNRKALLAAADAALYRAKAEGRNRVCIADRTN